LKTTTVEMEAYLKESEDKLLQAVYQHEKNKKLYSIHKEATKIMNEFNIEMPERGEAQPFQFAKSVKEKTKEKIMKDMYDKWRAKPLHGIYPTRIDQADVDQAKTHAWLRSSGLKAETEGFVIAAQDQSLPTRNYQCKILKTDTDSKCRLCHKYDETIDHIVSGCEVLAKNEYLERHNKALSYIHWLLCRKFHIKVEEKWYDHKPETVTENESVKLLWDMPIQTDREIRANRPDIIVKDKKENITLLIDMAVPSERNLANKEREKISKYKDLEIEISRMWQTRTATIPVVLSALGLVRRGMQFHMKDLDLKKFSVETLQKTVLLGTMRIVRKFLSL